MDLSHVMTAAGAWIAAHVSAPKIQPVIDKVFGKTNGSRKAGQLPLYEFKEEMKKTLAEVLDAQTKALESIAETNKTIDKNIAVLVDRSR